MAVVVETFYIGEREFTRTYSNANRYVVRDGVSYSEACDPAEFDRQYTEGELLPVDDSEAEEILDILLGGADE